MRLISLLLIGVLFVTILPARAAGIARIDPALLVGATPTEKAALHAAESDRTSYSLPPEKLAKATTLHHTFTALHFAGEGWTLLQLALILSLGAAARMRDLATRMTKLSWAQAALFLLQLLLLHTLLSLPLQIYAHRVVLRYDLSIQSWPSWALDYTKSLAVFYILGTLGVMLFFAIVRWSPRRWWLWFAAAASICILLGAVLTPYLYDPLFNQFTPLGQTHPEIVAWGKKLNIPADRMFLMNASAKVTTVNAYVTGLGPSKRVVVWDTSFRPGSEEDLKPILAHEMGHYVLNHVALGISLTMLSLFLELWIVYRVGQWLIARFGSLWKIPSPENLAALVVFLLVLAVLGFATEPIENSVSRWIEHNADVYGQEALHGIVADPAGATVAGFQHLGEVSLDEPNPSRFVEFWDYSHPSISHRAAFAKVYDPWLPGAAPKYFAK